ncbi:hypothetical protein ABTG15_18730, partial [Acinetobacter baumannii]
PLRRGGAPHPHPPQAAGGGVRGSLGWGRGGFPKGTACGSGGKAPTQAHGEGAPPGAGLLGS